MIKENIDIRRRLEDEEFSRMASRLRAAVTGEKNIMGTDRAGRIKSALDEILVLFGLEPADIPDGLDELFDKIDYVCRPYGIMYRPVKLDKGWYTSAVGPMLAITKDGTPVALTTGKTGVYSYIDPDTGTRQIISPLNEDNFEVDAVLFYRPFPNKAMTLLDFLKFLSGCVSAGSVSLIVLATALVTALGLVMPNVTRMLFSDAIAQHSYSFLTALFVVYISTTVASLLLNTVRDMLTARVMTELYIFTDAAAMARLLSLPAGFFKGYSSGELKERLSYVGQLSQSLVSAMLTTWLTSVFSLVYFNQVLKFARGLVLPSLIVTFLTVLFTTLGSFFAVKYTRRRMVLETKESGLVYSLISGIEKIKITGSEKRAFSKWMGIYADVAKLTYSPPKFMLLSSTITLAITLLGTVVIYYFAIKTNVSVSDYFAFNLAYGNISGAFTALAGIIMTIADLRPTWDMAKPILRTLPENGGKGKIIRKLSGDIELSSVTFRYNDSQPNIFDNFSLKVNKGDYLAIVGKTGCGKSTLVRLLLGFEKPVKGSVYYDGIDLNTVFLPSLRRCIGCVTQDGKLFQGDIYSNIVVSSPKLTLDDAWQAAETAGIADDIRAMPMEMHTVISEGGGGISGGQRQRLMIARAIAPKPSVLIFDEATSALDNITQKKVSDALDKLNCTRIVIAHRLSTIRHCNRIIVIDGGKIVEDGNYDELIAKDGYFAELVRRQRVEG